MAAMTLPSIRGWSLSEISVEDASNAQGNIEIADSTGTPSPRQRSGCAIKQKRSSVYFENCLHFKAPKAGLSSKDVLKHKELANNLCRRLKRAECDRLLQKNVDVDISTGAKPWQERNLEMCKYSQHDDLNSQYCECSLTTSNYQ